MKLRSTRQDRVSDSMLVDGNDDRDVLDPSLFASSPKRKAFFPSRAKQSRCRGRRRSRYGQVDQ
jgi:hypothetical protein